MTTRAALLTPPGVSAIATFQIVGPQSLDILQNIFQPHKKSGESVSYSTEKLHYGTLYDNEDILDSVIVAAEPEKQTVEIHCHGGPRIVQRLLMLLQKQDVEITPAQQLQPAESIAAEVEFTLPRAKTRLGVLAIASQHPGGLSSWIRSQIAGLQNKPNSLDDVKADLHALLPSFQIAQRLLNPPTVLLAGSVNVGKSTLANALTGRKQSLTADLPGTTRDWTAQLVDMNGLPVNLIDTPGRRETRDAIEVHALQLAENQIAQADLIVLVMEAGNQELEHLEKQKTLIPCDKEILIVVNKSDLISADQPQSNDLYVSALKESNLNSLRTAIANHFGVANFDPQSPLIFTQRQYDFLSEILSHTLSTEIVIQQIQSLI
jgi:tRNA modification GTPase